MLVSSSGNRVASNDFLDIITSDFMVGNVLDVPVVPDKLLNLQAFVLRRHTPYDNVLRNNTFIPAWGSLGHRTLVQAPSNKPCFMMRRQQRSDRRMVIDEGEV